ncbi:MAG: GDP-mannose dehydrogenase, partial [Candidatus Rokuibacteriota bacterium]
MRVNIFGMGYVGCVTAACLARAGHEVLGVDVSQEKVDMINAGVSPVVEPGLTELLAEVVGARRLRATTSPRDAVASSALSLICVGTPGRVNGQLDLRAIERVGRAIGEALT